MEDTVASRLKLFIDTSGLTSTQFADMCGIPRPSLSQILSGRNKKISDILVGQIHRAFPDLSVVWLLFGEGPVKTGSVKHLSTAPSPDDKFDDDENIGTFFNSSDQPRNISNAASSGILGRDSQAKSGNQNSINPYIRRDENENSNLRGLKSNEYSSNSTENEVFESDLKIMDLTRQIEQMRQNPRKVLQITIYYDDSTFETFVPK
ncbi:MAG: helix-turn-helix domain-containing protein [Muribaculaceae bacterium]|nr:helix-turn-helix domain-containing protein [Muribaculaceae bacterium]